MQSQMDAVSSTEKAVQRPRLLILGASPSPLDQVIHVLDERTTFDRVSTLPEFRQALTELAPDVVICAWSFPSGTWNEALEAVKQRAPGVPVVVVTSRGGSAEWYQVFTAGGFDLLEPPYTPSIVKWTVGKALESASSRRNGQRPARGFEE